LEQTFGSRKLDYILEKQRAHKKAIKDALAQFPEVLFRRIPDEKGDTATFLSFFFPDESRARKIAGKLAGAGIDGCFYWYDNNWHYIRQWNHLKRLKSAAKLPVELFEHRPNYEKMELLQSDKIIGRTISMLIKLSWTEDELKQRIEKIVGVIDKG
jgi:8-amino-3,8-dideoxy-alpha-D-manno-octulosonate transaminase